MPLFIQTSPSYFPRPSKFSRIRRAATALSYNVCLLANLVCALVVVKPIHTTKVTKKPRECRRMLNVRARNSENPPTSLPRLCVARGGGMKLESFRPSSECPYAAGTHVSVPHDRTWQSKPLRVPQKRPQLPPPAARTASHEHCPPPPHPTAADRPPQHPLPATRHRQPVFLPDAHAPGS